MPAPILPTVAEVSAWATDLRTRGERITPTRCQVAFRIPGYETARRLLDEASSDSTAATVVPAEPQSSPASAPVTISQSPGTVTRVTPPTSPASTSMAGVSSLPATHLSSGIAALADCRAAYEAFLRTKIPQAEMAGIEPPNAAHPSLKPHQVDLATWCLRGGRRACFANFGLGKTRIHLQVAKWVTEVTTGKYLIVAPLGVRQEFTLSDGPAMGLVVEYVRTREEAAASTARILITNYERVRDGDLTTQVRDDANDEFTPLLAALKAMQDSLTSVVAGVRGNAESVSTASAEIAQGVQTPDVKAKFEPQGAVLVSSPPDKFNAIIKSDVEYILLQRKPGGYRSPTEEQRQRSRISKTNFTEWFQQLWRISGATDPVHPAPFPLVLADRLVRMFSFWGDTVLDPFAGTGTTLLAAARAERDAIGVEVDPVYFDLAVRTARSAGV